MASQAQSMDLKFQNLLRIFERRSSYFWLGIGITCVSLLGVADYLTGNEIVFSLFYLLPISLVTLAGNKTQGQFISFLSALTLLLAEIAAGQVYSHPIIYFWNTLIRTGLFSLVSFLIQQLHQSQKEERLAARTDFVTGAVNARYFNELLQFEIDRIRRYPHPFTVVFIDIDNFKTVNDLFGHGVGDSVLRYISDELKAHLRKSDVVARVGGDEFALLLPSVRGPAAMTILAKVRSSLDEAMRQRNLTITFSMGVVTCVKPPYAAEQLINLADNLMYMVKNSTKNGIRFVTWGENDKEYEYVLPKGSAQALDHRG